MCTSKAVVLKAGAARVLLTFKQAIHSPEGQAGNHVLVDNDTGAVLLRCMAQVLAEEAPGRAEGPTPEPWSPDMHLQAEEGCHPSTQAVPCTTSSNQTLHPHGAERGLGAGAAAVCIGIATQLTAVYFAHVEDSVHPRLRTQ